MIVKTPSMRRTGTTAFTAVRKAAWRKLVADGHVVHPDRMDEQELDIYAEGGADAIAEQDDIDEQVAQWEEEHAGEFLLLALLGSSLERRL